MYLLRRPSEEPIRGRAREPDCPAREVWWDGDLVRERVALVKEIEEAIDEEVNSDGLCLMVN